MTPHSLLVGGAFILPFAANAQAPFEFADSRTPHTSYGPCVSMTAGWAVSGYSYGDDGDPGSAFIRGFAPAGDSLWSHPIVFQYAQASIVDVASMANGEVVTGASLIECDVGLGGFLAERIAPDGSTVWSHVFSNGNGWLNAFALSPSESIAFCTGSGILITGTAGDSLTWFGLPDAQYATDLAWDSDTSLITTTSWAGTVARWSSTGDLLATGQVAGPVKDMVCWKGHRLLVAGPSKLYGLGEDLAVVDSMELGVGYENGKLLPLGQSLLIAGEDQVLVLDSALAPVDALSLDPEDEFPSGLFSAFAANDSALLMTASVSLGGCSNGLVRSIGMDGSHAPHAVNVGISILSMDSVYYDLVGGMVFPKADATVRLSNLGPDTVNDVLVAHNGVSGVACGMYGSSVEVQGAGLAPGAFLDVQLVGMNLWAAPWEYIVEDQPLCIVALSPDHLFDRDQGDNIACDTAHIVLGIADNEAPNSPMVVNNPFQDVIELRFTTSSTRPLNCSLYDGMGRRVAVEILPPGLTEFRWSLPGLRDGMYLLDVIGQGSRAVCRLMRQSLR